MLTTNSTSSKKTTWKQFGRDNHKALHSNRIKYKLFNPVKNELKLKLKVSLTIIMITKPTMTMSMIA